MHVHVDSDVIRLQFANSEKVRLRPEHQQLSKLLHPLAFPSIASISSILRQSISLPFSFALPTSTEAPGFLHQHFNLSLASFPYHPSIIMTDRPIPVPPLPGKASVESLGAGTPGLWDRITTWASEHKAAVYTIAGVTLLVTAGGVIYYVNDSNKSAKAPESSSSSAAAKRRNKKDRKKLKKEAEEAQKKEAESGRTRSWTPPSLEMRKLIKE